MGSHIISFKILDLGLFVQLVYLCVSFPKVGFQMTELMSNTISLIAGSKCWIFSCRKVFECLLCNVQVSVKVSVQCASVRPLLVIHPAHHGPVSPFSFPSGSS